MTLRKRTSLSALLLLSLTTLSIAANSTGGGQLSEKAKAQALINYSKRPLSFEENRGQAEARVKFLSRGSRYAIRLAPAEVSLDLYDTAKKTTVRMGFPGAKSSPVLSGADRQSGVSSYFIGNDPSKWVSGAPNYARVEYRELYPGVDLTFYGNQGQLEYDFVLAPGANPRAIRMQFDGVDSMRLNRAGDLVLSAAHNEIYEHKPAVYQEGAHGRQPVGGRYVIQPHNRVSFEIAAYDRSKPLIIDPTLSFATYIGSPGDELYSISGAAATATYPAVAVDSLGNVYVTGFDGGSAATFLGHPLTLTGSQGTNGSDVYVVKLDATGTALRYSVVFGGSPNFDVGQGIAVDAQGDAFITGFTMNPNFPITAGAAQPSLPNAATNAFVTEVNASGTALVYSTYLGGSGKFIGQAIALDPQGNAYVTGAAAASDGTPLCSPCSLSSTPSSGFLTEVTAGGTAFTYSTYIPAGIGYGIAVDQTGAAYVTGSTGTILNPSPAQGYVLKVAAGGSGLDYSPVLLGNSGAQLQTIGFGIAIDSQKDAYVTGMTNDAAFPQITAGTAQTSYGGGLTDGFAIKLNSNGSSVLYGTYIGGIGSNLLPERGSSIGVDAEGNAYVAGTTQCLAFPTANSIPGTRIGSPAVLMKGSASATTSVWNATSLAGRFDQVDALAFDPSGNLYAGTSAANASGGGVYVSTNGGNTWSAATTGISSSIIDSIAVDPNTPTTIYAAAAGHIYQTTNSGGNWSQLGEAVGSPAVLAVAKTSPSTVYVASSVGLFYSTNGGSSWNTPTAAPAGTVDAIAIDPNNAMTAYAGSSNGSVYRTVNGGATWTAVSTGLAGGPVTGLAINGSTSTIYAATGTGLFYSTNAGANWSQITIGQVPSTPYLVAVDSANNVYVAFQGAGMATGTGGGTQIGDWSALTFNGLTQNQIKALAVPPGSSGTAFAGIVSATTAFVTEISPNGSSFLSSTCIGGSDNNLGQSVAVTSGGTILLSGATISANFPATAGAVQTVNAGLYDAFAIGIDVVVVAQIASPLAGLELSNTSATFTWNDAGAAQYLLTVGTTPGGGNIFNGLVSGTSKTVDFVPCTGGNLYVSIAAEVNGTLQSSFSYSYSCKSAVGSFRGTGTQDMLWQNSSTHQVNVNYFGGTGPQPNGSAVLNNGASANGWKLVGAADFDHNGVPDLVWQNQGSGQVNVNYYGGNGTQIIGFAVLNSGAGTSGWSVVAVADMNGDGSPDLIWHNNNTGQVNVNYYGGSGGSTFIGWAELNSGAGTSGWTVVAAADFDQNGTPDLVWQNQASGQVNVNYYGGKGGATFIGWAELNNGSGTSGWSVVGAADWNDDGVPDLVWQNASTGQVNVNYYGGGGGGAFKGWNCLNCGSNFVGLRVGAVAAYGNSGEQSLVYQNSSSNAAIVYYYSYGGAIFQGWNELNSGAGTSGWKVVGAADFDGNGVPDLVWQNQSTGQVNVNYYGGTGGAQFIGWALLNSGAGTAGWSVVAVADMNGDGVPDLIWQNATTGQVNVNYYGGTNGAKFIGWAELNNGAGTSGWKVVAAADFDGNGVPDLIWQNQSTGQVNVNYYGGPTSTNLIGWAILNSGAGTSGWAVVGANDFDGNGIPDLVWQNSTTGQVNVNYYGGPRGSQFKGWNVVGTAPGWVAIVPHER